VTAAAGFGGPARARWAMPLFAVVLYGAFLIVNAPADTVAWALAATTKGTATLDAPRGSAWRGQAAAIAIVDPAGRQHLYEGVIWEWQALPATFQLRLNDPNIQASARVMFSIRATRVEDVSIHLPASALADYVQSLQHAGLSGDVSVRSERVTLDGTSFSGTAVIDWRNAASTSSRMSPLGDYRAYAVGAGPRVQFRVDTLGGALRVEGQGSWSQSSGLSFEGSARQADGADRPQLTELLKMLGPDRGSAVHLLRIGKAT
jgi:hypothetical protein